MQISVSIEPYLGVEKTKLIQYIENIVQLSRKFKAENKGKVCLHFDYFKSNPEVFRLVQSYAKQIEIDLHLMREPVSSVDGFRAVCFDIVDWQKNSNQLNNNIYVYAVNAQARGLVLDLGREIRDCEDLIRAARYIIIMTVKCGKSGQVFHESSLSLVTQIRDLNPHAVIIVDGGVNENNIQLLKDAGVDVAVVGNYAKKCYENGSLEIGINRLLHN